MRGMHGREQKCTQNCRKEKTLKTYFSLPSSTEMQKDICVGRTSNFRSCVITILCIGLMHHFLQQHRLMNTVTAGRRILENIHRNETISQSIFISSLNRCLSPRHEHTNERFYKPRNSINTEAKLSVIPRIACLINLIR